nr:FAA hydrolase family protein [Desulfobacterales bacterium]
MQASGQPMPLDWVRFAPVVRDPSKIIAIRLNYLDHVRESKGKVPEISLVFAKLASSLIAHNDWITGDTRLTRKVDFEVELPIITGKTVYNCDGTQTMDSILGYTCANDGSARDPQFGDGERVRGKSLCTFCPLGPWIVTSDKISDSRSLGIRGWPNGRIMRDSNTSSTILKLPKLISFLSKNFTLSRVM